MSDGKKNRRKERRRKAQKAVDKMPRPRMGDDPAEIYRWTEQWIDQTERDAGGDQLLLDMITQMADQEMRLHTAQHLQASIITTRAADRRLQASAVSKEAVSNTHLARHRSPSAEDRTCIPLGPRAEETLVVCYSPDEGRTKVWSLGEGAKDPVPGTVQRWRHGPWSWPMCLTRRSSERFPSSTHEHRRPLLLRLRGPRPSLRRAKGRCIPLRSIPRPRYFAANYSIFWSLGPHLHRGNGYRRPKSRSGRGRLDGL